MLPITLLFLPETSQIVFPEISIHCQPFFSVKALKDVYKRQIYHRVGECIMPVRGVFARVLKSGRLTPGDEILAFPPSPKRPFTAAVITLSDKGADGLRVDESGPAAVSLLSDAGYRVIEAFLIPDEPKELSLIHIFSPSPDR